MNRTFAVPFSRYSIRKTSIVQPALMVLLLAAGPSQVLPAEGPASGSSPRWVFCCHADNDLYRVATNYWPQTLRAESVNEAFRQSPPEAGVLVLADGYPESTTTITPENLVVLHEKRLRLYVEYPSTIPGLSLGAPHATEWERAVVCSDAFGKSCPGCAFWPSMDAASSLQKRPHRIWPWLASLGSTLRCTDFRASATRYFSSILMRGFWWQRRN